VNVRFRGKSGSRRPPAQPTRLTHKRHSGALNSRL